MGSVRDTILKYWRNRQFEWTMAVIICLFSVHIILWPETFVYSRYANVLLLIGPMKFAVFMLISGLITIVGILGNGRMPVCGSNLRAAGALFRSLIWVQLGMSLYTLNSPGMWMYFGVALSEFLSIIKAIDDRINA